MYSFLVLITYYYTLNLNYTKQTGFPPLYTYKAPVPYMHGSTRQSRIVPDPAGSRSGTIRAHFGVFERRRSSNNRHAGGNTAATRTNPDNHGSYTAATRNQHGAHTDDQRPSRTVTAERRTNTDLHGSDTDQHGSNTDQHGPPRTFKNLYKSRLIFGDSAIGSRTCHSVLQHIIHQ